MHPKDTLANIAKEPYALTKTQTLLYTLLHVKPSRLRVWGLDFGGIVMLQVLRSGCFGDVTFDIRVSMLRLKLQGSASGRLGVLGLGFGVLAIQVAGFRGLVFGPRALELDLELDQEKAMVQT